MPIGEAPTASRLEWLDRNLPAVPLDVAATGPRVIDVGARLADRVTFALGADVPRLAWAAERASATRRASGGGPLSLGACLIVVPTTDLRLGRWIAASKVAAHARFSVMHGNVVGPVSEHQADALRTMVSTYDLGRHGSADQPAVMSDELIDEQAIVGPVNYCVERLLELHEIGLERFVFLRYPDDESAARAYRSLIEDVLPSVRGSRRASGSSGGAGPSGSATGATASPCIPGKDGLLSGCRMVEGGAGEARGGRPSIVLSNGRVRWPWMRHTRDQGHRPLDTAKRSRREGADLPIRARGD